MEVNWWTREAEDRLRAMVAEGYSQRRIASVLGRSRASVGCKAKALNLRCRPPGRRKHDDAPRAPERPVRLIELTARCCRSVEGQDEGGAWYCGRLVTRRADGVPSRWCAEHHRLFTVPGKPVRAPWDMSSRRVER